MRHALGQFAAQKTGGVGQALERGFVVLAEHGEPDLGVLQVARHFHGGEGHAGDAGILHFAHDDVRQFLADLLGDAAGAGIDVGHV
jgi:hypothetical protein